MVYDKWIFYMLYGQSDSHHLFPCAFFFFRMLYNVLCSLSASPASRVKFRIPRGSDQYQRLLHQYLSRSSFSACALVSSGKHVSTIIIEFYSLWSPLTVFFFNHRLTLKGTPLVLGSLKGRGHSIDYYLHA